MRLYRCWYVVLLVVFGPDALAETLSHGRFDKIAVYRPQGEPRQTVLFFSGERGWSTELEPIAQSLARQGALVAGIDAPAFFRNLEKDGGNCVSPDGDLENLSHFLQAYYRLPTYRPALLIGERTGAEFVHAMLAQAPAGTFGGGISLGFCPMRNLKKPLCPSSKAATAPPLSAPWMVLQGVNDRQCRDAAKGFLAKVKQAEIVAVAGDDYGDGDFHTWEPQFAAAFQRLAARTRGLPPVNAAELKDLPIVEVPATGKSDDTLAVLISGDGGWAGIDKELAAALSKQGMPVVGLDSLRYFWKARTPESTAADVDRLLRHYMSAWKKQSVLLIGFSQGADVMPFVVNRLPAATRERLRLVGLLSLSQTAVFEFHLQNWLGADKGAIPVAPELLRMKGVRGLCVYGADETDSLCAQPAAKALQVVKLSGGHHFDGNYANLASLLLSHMH
ncbi:AcvB/VirJ family lysyl-phosphatidylglycerol hydrolase [Steroidobacter sp.]|uniref:AcvB/VirJ family lysyl-phosphatidylglycerol hydrolase n=1 Tax=Steroidobacter sp. TaxID=1978227 RepID=UPI001A4E74B9|nr:AcvB/VirJ family lysyl-phosphatidylglycerol hydrolase [Steroidobacter sp.]MBL8272123.1 virulence factor family protein [Steroidobacter sp.]